MTKSMGQFGMDLTLLQEWSMPKELDQSVGACQPQALLVEDDPVQRSIIKKEVERAGFAVTEANGIAEAREAFRRQSFDVGLVDWYLSDGTGLDLIQNHPGERLFMVPLIVLTAQTDPSLLEQALEQGAFDFLRKPAHPVELRARLKSALRYREIQQKYFDLSSRDPLTGVYNRRYFQSTLVPHVTAHAEAHVFSLCMLDIDHFKSINDGYGHPIGDLVLQQLAQLLLSHLRTTDTICRFGGEEFVLFLDGADGEVALKVMERILSAARKKTWGDRSHPFRVTFSAGISTFRCGERSDPDLGETLRRADEALYRAKNSGRNRIVVATEENTEKQSAS